MSYVLRVIVDGILVETGHELEPIVCKQGCGYLLESKDYLLESKDSSGWWFILSRQALPLAYPEYHRTYSPDGNFILEFNWTDASLSKIPINYQVFFPILTPRIQEFFRARFRHCMQNMVKVL